MEQIGKLRCIVNDPGDFAQTIVLFHGFGADAYDLQTLSEVIHPKKPTRWVFPQGILEVPIGPGWTGRAWWQIDMQALQEAAAKGEYRNMEETVPANIEKLRGLVFEMLKNLHVPMEQIILGGFSQGAMLATDIFLHAEQAPAGLVIMSGNLICKPEWQKIVENRKGSSFFMSHGSSDAVLPVQGAQKLETLLTQAGLKGHLQRFSGGHEIPPQIIASVQNYLDKL